MHINAYNGISFGIGMGIYINILEWISISTGIRMDTDIGICWNKLV